jgi:hypothetical protein|tara:strand:+ start:127 stop:849 length:723 start_codon:yes stop_codon:yes gene_type:complete
MKQVVVYTAIFGNYDSLIEPVYTPSNVDFICFTDNQDLKSDVWQIIYQPTIYSTANRNAKKFKVLPHRYFTKYEYSIWVDGNMLVQGDVNNIIKTVLSNSNVAFFSHANNVLDSRKCAYDEANYILDIGQQNYQRNPSRGILAWKDNPETIVAQMNKYKMIGFPTNHELITGMVIARKHNEVDSIKVMEDWWSEIKYHSKRDQLSFNFCAWKNNLNLNYIPGDSRENIYFKNLGSHKGKK